LTTHRLPSLDRQPTRGAPEGAPRVGRSIDRSGAGRVAPGGHEGHASHVARGDRPYRIDFLTVIPSPYQTELFDAVARHPGLDPRVYYYTDTSPDRQWTPPSLPDHSTVLPGVALHALTRCCCFNPTAVHRLRREPADLVVVGDYFTLTAQLVMRNLTRRGVPWVFWGEIPGLNQRSRAGCMLRKFAQRPMVRGAEAVAAIGSRARDAYRDLLSDDRPVVNIPYHCDLSAFLAIERHDTATQPLRLLFSGQMIPRKGVDVLLEAYRRLRRGLDHQTPPPQLTLLGDGPQRQAYASHVPDELRGDVSFRGFQPPDALPHEFAKADVFVLPSRHDGWGLVINEAIAAGMPVITTDRVGAAHDLVEHDQNGYVIPSDDPNALAQAMARFVADRTRVSAFGRCSRRIAQDYTPERGAERWFDLCETLLDSRKTNP